MHNQKPSQCRHCRAALVQPASGRPRTVCPAPKCQRFAEATRKLVRRRRRAGVPDTPLWGVERYTKGGRDPLIRRMARKLAGWHFRYVTPTDEEWRALEAAVRVGAGSGDLGALADGKASWRTNLTLPAEERRVLRRLQKRNREADPQYERKRRERSERRGRWNRFWETFRTEAARSKDRGNIFGQLLEQLPEERRQPVFRALARALHPDVGGDAELMKLLNVAYESFDPPAPIAAQDAAGDDEAEAAEDAAAEEVVRAFLARS